jgi:hypothetical protein
MPQLRAYCEVALDAGAVNRRKEKEVPGKETSFCSQEQST